jgi:hypothetical protein
LGIGLERVRHADEITAPRRSAHHCRARPARGKRLSRVGRENLWIGGIAKTVKAELPAIVPS